MSFFYYWCEVEIKEKPMVTKVWYLFYVYHHSIKILTFLFLEAVFPKLSMYLHTVLRVILKQAA